MKNYVDKDKLQEYTTKLTAKNKTIFATKLEVGSPLVASTVAEMTDTNRIYVYVGSESGYTSGNWYYYDGSAWVSGGIYNSVAFETDDTLSVTGAAADAKAVGDTLEANSQTAENKFSQLQNAYSLLIPKEYRQVEYLQSHGTEYIDCGVIASNNTRIICDFQRITSGQQRLFGARRSSSTRAFAFAIDENGYYLSNYNTILYTSSVLDDFRRTTVDFNKNEVYVNGKVINGFSAATFTSPNAITLFAIHASTGSQTHWFGEFRVFSFKIYENDVLICDYVPCIRISDNVCGMYDLVSNTFKTNGGTGTFEHGDIVTIQNNSTKNILLNDKTNIIAPVEISNVSLRSYSIGDYFIIGNNIYRATNAISSGDTLRPGVNCEETVVTKEFEAIKAFKNRTQEFEHFTVKTNLAWPNTSSTSGDNAEIKNETDILCVLSLPQTYSAKPSSDPTPLILYGHPMSCRITSDSWYGNDANFLAMIRAFTAAGYAVFDVNNTRDRNGGFYDWGSLPLMTAYIKAWEYIKNNYNVEKKLYILSSSMGTNVALNMLKWYGSEVVTALMTAPRPILKTRYSGYTSDTDKKIMAAAYGLISDADINDSSVPAPNVSEFNERFSGFEQVENKITIGNVDYIFEKFPPVKVLVGQADSDYYTETKAYYDALNAAGNYVNYREVLGADHTDMVSLIPGSLKDEAVNWFDRFRYKES